MSALSPIALRLTADDPTLFTDGATELIQDEKIGRSFPGYKKEKISTLQSMREILLQSAKIAKAGLFLILNGHGTSEGMMITKERRFSPYDVHFVFGGLNLKKNKTTIVLDMCCPGKNYLAQQIALTTGVYVTCIEGAVLCSFKSFFLRNEEGELEWFGLGANNVVSSVTYNPNGRLEPKLYADREILEEAASQGYPYALFKINDQLCESRQIDLFSSLIDKFKAQKQANALWEISQYHSDPALLTDAETLGSPYAAAELTLLKISNHIAKYEPIYQDLQKLINTPPVFHAFISLRNQGNDYLFLLSLLQFLTKQKTDLISLGPQHAFQLGLIFRDVLKNLVK